MVSPRRSLANQLGAERCCPAQCDYRPEAIQHYINVVLDMERAGEDASVVAGGKPISRDGSGGTVGDGPTRIWDVQAAIRALRFEGREITAVAVAAKLCPWALDA